jgi:cytochrome c biogenesis protein ResB
VNNLQPVEKREAPARNLLLKRFLNAISSSKLALVLVLLVIVFSIAGAMLPQEGQFDPNDIARWQEQHSLITKLLRPIGLFRAFHSVPFLVTICLLALNTFTCSVLYFFRKGGFSALKGPDGVRLSGFVILHLSLILLFAGGFLSAGATLDGYIVLTEGQIFKEEHRNYVRLVEGPLRREQHKGFNVRLKELKTVFPKDKRKYPVDITSILEFGGNTSGPVEIKVNQPHTYKDMSFTQDETGFSPRLLIRRNQDNRIVLHSFLALKTFRRGGQREYRDFLPIPSLPGQKQRLIITFFPYFSRENNRIKKISDKPNNPLLLVELKNAENQTLEHTEIPMKGTGNLKEYSITFTGLRRWASFRVMEDPGYGVVLISLLLGLIGILLRYLPDFKGWLRSDSSE